MRGGTLTLIEKTNYKKVGEIASKVQFHTAEDCNDASPLDQFDRAVLSACISEWAFGNRYTTVAILYRILTGKIAKGHDAKPHPLQRENILKSILKVPSISTKELATMYSLSARQVQRIMTKMKDQGLIRRVGPDKGGHWEVINNN